MKHYVTKTGFYGYDDAWKVGDVEVYRLIEAQWQVPITWYNGVIKDPDFSPESLKKLEWMVPYYAGIKNGNFITQCNVHMYLVKCKGKNIIIDTGGNYEFTDGDWLDQLAALGCKPEDVDYVMFTHIHGDHFARNIYLGEWNDPVATFPNARYLFQQEGYDFFINLQINPAARKGSVAHDIIWPFRISCLSLVEQNRVDFIDYDFNLLDTITVEPLPGHVPGNLAIKIKDGDQEMWICGDMFHNPFQMTMTDASPTWEHDPQQSIRTRLETMERLSKTDIYFLCAHFGKGGFVRKTDSGYILVPDFVTDHDKTFQEYLDEDDSIDLSAISNSSDH